MVKRGKRETFSDFLQMTLPLKWLAEKPIWVKQWPLTEDKLQALEQLVQEQIDPQHLQESTSPWNSPVFVVKEKSGK